MPELFPEFIDTTDNSSFEKILNARGYTCVAGCDEAGRGPLAGPVVAGCVVLPLSCDFTVYKDSKTLKQSQREALYHLLQTTDALVGVGIVSQEMIDRINILQASLLAMRLAVNDLASERSLPDFLLIDGKFPVPIDIPQQTLVKGESKSGSIAAASIVAKVVRDKIMDELHECFPVYNFRQHKGYPTQQHRQLLQVHGPCPAHRLSFKGVREHGQ